MAQWLSSEIKLRRSTEPGTGILLELVHCTTQPEPRGFQMLASAHALHLTTSYSCPSIQVNTGSSEDIWKCLEVVQEFRS